MTVADTILPRQERRGLAAPSLLWGGAIGGTLALGILSGGSSQADSIAFQGFRLLSILLMAAGLLRLAQTRPSRLERAGIALAIAMVALLSLHLLPLPYAIAGQLPGREVMAKAFALSGIAPGWAPLTLSPEATKACLLALLPALAMFVAMLTADSRGRWVFAGTVLLGAVASTFLGLAQRFQGPQSGLYLYEIANFGSATGFFSNRNNFAMLLCVAIPLTWAVSHRMIRRSHNGLPLAIAAGASMMIVIFTGLAASNSRSGIFLGMLALLLSTAMVWSNPTSSRRSKRNKYSLFVVLGAALIIGQFGMVGILRIVETDPMTEYRGQISEVTWRAAADYFPWGSGFGTFRPIYAMHETPATMRSAYVNHAHNDLLELWLEGGLPAALLMACFLCIFAYQAARLWNPKGHYEGAVLQRAASIGVLVLMTHSLVEFPLRSPGLAAVFGGLLAIMLAPPTQQRHHTHTSRRSSRRAEEEPLQRREDPVIPSAPPKFKVSRTAGETQRNTIESDSFVRQHKP